MDRDKNRDALVADIYLQAKGEEDAKMEYSRFLAKWRDSSLLQPVDIAKLSEVLADEANHTLILLAMAKKYSKVKPTDDGLAEALEFLGK